jgi:hypothetical protein
MPDFIIPKQKLPYLTGRKLHAAKIKDGFENRSWAEYFIYLSSKADITLQPNLDSQLEAAAEHLFPLWMANFAENVRYIRDESAKSISQLASPEVVEKPLHSAVVIGRGPSVFNHEHLSVLADAQRKSEFKGLVVASDGMLIECLKHGIVPDLTVSVDGSHIIRKWYDNELVDSKVHVALPVTIHNSVYQECVKRGVTVYWYLPMFDLFIAKESITKVLRAMTATAKNPDGFVMTSVGGNSGTAAWVFAAFILKCSPVALIGIDFGYPEGTKLLDTPYYSAMITQPVDVSASYDEVYHPVFKTKAHIDNVFKHYREAFLSLQYFVKPWYSMSGGTVNCTEGGTLFGVGVRCMKFAEFLAERKGKN